MMSQGVTEDVVPGVLHPGWCTWGLVTLAPGLPGAESQLRTPTKLVPEASGPLCRVHSLWL